MHKGMKRIIPAVSAMILIALLALTGCSRFGGSTMDKIEKANEKVHEASEKLDEAKDKLGDAKDKLGKAAKKLKEITKRHAKSRRQLKTSEDLKLRDVSGNGSAFVFNYGGEEFRAEYLPDNWTIYDSYKILNRKDIQIICKALSDIHPVHGKDLKSYRTPKDMTYEWQQHNIMYDLLPDGSRWKESARNVDLDPYDQGKSYQEIYEDRTGKKFDLNDFI